MPDIGKLSTGIRPADIPERQITAALAENCEAGDAVRLDTANGTLTKANTTSAAEARFYGILLEGGIAGQFRTAVRRGRVAGFNLASLAHDADVFLGRTDGAIADAADATAGAVNVTIGRVVPATANGAPPYDKILEVL
jgi:hypothetical protein